MIIWQIMTITQVTRNLKTVNRNKLKTRLTTHIVIKVIFSLIRLMQVIKTYLACKASS